MHGEYNLENDLIHRLIGEKKWAGVLREMDQLLMLPPNLEVQESLISFFESIDPDYRLVHAQRYYIHLWKVAFNIGKIRLAKSYAIKALDYLVEFKRIPQIKKIIEEFKHFGILKNNKKFDYPDFILGKKNCEPFSASEDWSFLEAHPETWKDSKEMLKQFLIGESEWGSIHWKLAYEYILKFHFDRDLFMILTEKSVELKKEKHKAHFLELLQKKKISVERFQKIKTIAHEVKEEKPLHLDYDQVAMDVMSGTVEPSITEQRKILLSIATLTDEEILKKGKDMIVAFGLLGMDKVVVNLCEKLIPLLENTHERASTQFMMAQSLYNSGSFYKSIDLIDDTFRKEPLLKEEQLAFSYLKAESFMKLKKFKKAKELFLEIKKQHPSYRLVSERLRDIETIK